MKKLTLTFALLAAGTYAQAASHEHAMQHDMAAQAASAATHQGRGTVKTLKPGKIQIAHEPIASLEWPAMTMWFEWSGDRANGIKVGDRVRFEMRQNARKQWVIEKLDPQ